MDKHGALMKSEMAKETEGQRRQELEKRQLVKGRGGRICNRQGINACFPYVLNLQRLTTRDEEGEESGGWGSWKGEEGQQRVTDPKPEG